MSTTVTDVLRGVRLCTGSRRWLATQPPADLEGAWQRCPQPDWLIVVGALVEVPSELLLGAAVGVIEAVESTAAPENAPLVRRGIELVRTLTTAFSLGAQDEAREVRAELTPRAWDRMLLQGHAGVENALTRVLLGAIANDPNTAAPGTLMAGGVYDESGAPWVERQRIHSNIVRAAVPWEVVRAAAERHLAERGAA